jgi:DNA-binding response OmpR family regulator
MTEHTHKILIVDDDRFLTNMYSHKFGKEGFDVVIANNSEQALSLLRGNLNPDVLLLDVILPGMTGIELLKKIREEKLASDAAVVMLSNQGSKENINEAKDMGIDCYIVKATTIPSETVDEVRKVADARKK